MMAIAEQKPVTTARRWLRMASEDGSFKNKTNAARSSPDSFSGGSYFQYEGGRFTLGAIAACHCWMPLLGAIAGAPLLGATMHAIAGCNCWGAMAGC